MVDNQIRGVTQFPHKLTNAQKSYLDRLCIGYPLWAVQIAVRKTFRRMAIVTDEGLTPDARQIWVEKRNIDTTQSINPYQVALDSLSDVQCGILQYVLAGNTRPSFKQGQTSLRVMIKKGILERPTRGEYVVTEGVLELWEAWAKANPERLESAILPGEGFNPRLYHKTFKSVTGPQKTGLDLLPVSYRNIYNQLPEREQRFIRLRLTTSVAPGLVKEQVDKVLEYIDYCVDGGLAA